MGSIRAALKRPSGYFSFEDVPRVRDCLGRPGQDLPALALNAKMLLELEIFCSDVVGDFIVPEYVGYFRDGWLTNIFSRDYDL